MADENLLKDLNYIEDAIDEIVEDPERAHSVIQNLLDKVDAAINALDEITNMNPVVHTFYQAQTRASKASKKIKNLK